MVIKLELNFMLNSSNLPLEKRKIIKKSLASFPVFLLSLLLGGYSLVIGILLYEEVSWSWPLIILGIILSLFTPLAIVLYQIYYYKSYFYSFGEKGAEIGKGVFSRSTGYVQYDKIQNIYVDQDFLDRLFNLYDVHYETAGEVSGTYSHVDGLNQTNARKLVDFLNEKVSAKNMPEEQLEQETILSDNEKISKVISRQTTPLLKNMILPD